MSTNLQQNTSQASRSVMEVLYDEGRVAPYASDYKQFGTGSLVLSLSGTATAVTVQVQRSPTPPDRLGNASWAPADVAVSGSLATGVLPVEYIEPTFGWWRVNVTAVSGGTVSASLSGQLVPGNGKG